MADVTITAANVVKGAGANTKKADLGATVTAGQLVYKDPSDGHKCKPAQCDGTANEADAFGFALSGGADEQASLVQTGGELTVGGTLVAGQVYYESATAGAICLFSDLVTGNRVVIVGYAKSTAILVVDIINLAITKA